MSTSSPQPWESPDSSTYPQGQEAKGGFASSPFASSWWQSHKSDSENTGADQNPPPQQQFRPRPWQDLPQRASQGSDADIHLWNAFTQQTGGHSVRRQGTDPWNSFHSTGNNEVLLPQQYPQPGSAYPPMMPPQGSLYPLNDKPQQRKKSKRRLFIILGITLAAVVALGGTALFIFRSTIKHAFSGSLSGVTISDTIALTDITLSGAQTYRFDYQTVDLQKGWLITTRSGADRVMIFDIHTKKVIAEISGIVNGHGVLSIPEINRIYASSGHGNEVVSIDETSFKIVSRIKVGAGPDGMAYDPVERLLYVSDELGNDEAVINVRTDKLVTKIPLKSAVGNTQYDPATDTIYVNLEDSNELGVINPKTNKLVARHPLDGCVQNHGMSIDTTNHLIFIACIGAKLSNPGTLVEVDMKTWKTLDKATIGPEPDVLAFDDSRHMLYVATESGIVSIFMEQGIAVHKLTEGYIAKHAHTVGVNQQTHDVYLLLEDLNGTPTLQIAQFTPPAGS